MAESPTPQNRDDRGVVELVEAIIDDLRELVGAHVEALRDDMGSRISSLGATVATSLAAFSILIVTALLVGIALALTLVAVGLPAWAAFWIVAMLMGLVGYLLVRRLQRAARDTGDAASDAVAAVKQDIAWISDHTDDKPSNRKSA